MRKTLGLLLVVSLVFGTLGLPAAAKKKKKKAKPIAYTLYMHGTQPIGEAEYADSVANATGFMKMDEAEPTESAPKSFGLINYVAGPNTSCSGNALFPTWTGAVAGAVTGDLKIYLNAVSHAASTVQVDVFADAAGGCTSTATGSEDYVPPVVSTTVTLGPGSTENEIVFEDVSFKSLANIVIMVTPNEIELDQTRNDPTSQTRLLYDSPDFATRLEFTCIPNTGKSCIL